ncbi:MAG TPA: ABC transporter permease [Acidimicrobiia bacterium]|nr:ABC transporter permease [Acidimicrobiia bacterium]
MRKILAIGWANTKRFLRQRSNVFFVFVFPLLLILLLGMMFGGGFDAKVGVHVAGDGGPLASALVTALDDLEDMGVVTYDSEAAVTEAVQRGLVTAGVLVPVDYDAALMSGGSVEVRLVARAADQNGMLSRETVRDVVSRQATPIRAARFAAAQGVASFADALPVGQALAAREAGIAVAYSQAGESAFEGFENLGTFDLGAGQELVLFMFLTSLTAAADLILTRRLGVARRMLSTPTSTAVIVGGEVAGRFGVAMVQGIYIMVGTLLIFGVNWGDPLGAIAIMVVFALVGSGAAMLSGSIFRNEQQAGGIGVLLGLGLAAVGGAMVPIELFPGTMKNVALFTPHAWAIDAFAELVRRDGGLFDILPQLGMLAVFAVFFLVLATWRLRRVLTR